MTGVEGVSCEDLIGIRGYPRRFTLYVGVAMAWYFGASNKKCPRFRDLFRNREEVAVVDALHRLHFHFSFFVIGNRGSGLGQQHQ